MRKGREKREENLEADFSNPKVPVGAIDPELGPGQEPMGLSPWVSGFPSEKE